MSKKERKLRKEKKEDAVEVFDEFYLENMLYYTRVPDAYKNREAYKPLNEKVLKAFIPGTIREMNVEVGETIEVGQKLMILDAMKMDNVVKAMYSGTVKSIHVKEGEMVKKNQVILEFA
ncbi:MAG: acetyl-CoA carboxylase biotin carboxyl carrier protein subunit [Bacteroidales bacterium]|nr:acetyl-CoA carboxylase biotin carboxyl carrier protein subunit [Bacteroidales bacterium]